MKIHISKGNNKLGTVPSISLTPILSCGDVKCFDKCYACNIIRRFKHVKIQWEQNLKYYNDKPQYYFAELFFWLIDKTPTHFRFHIGGDIPDKRYLQNVYTLCRDIPYIKFMMFTKRYSWIKHWEVPNNLNILLSMWPYMEKAKTTLISKTWIRGDLRIPNNVFKCKGQCTDCYQCWSKNTEDILLKGH